MLLVEVFTTRIKWTQIVNVLCKNQSKDEEELGASTYQQVNTK